MGEAIGTALLLYLIVGSGIMVGRSGADFTVQLFAHGVVVGVGLAALIALFISVSGAHFNPSVSMASAMMRSTARVMAVWYVATQLVGSVAGVVLANLSFGLDPVTVSTTTRMGAPQLLSEFIGTFGLVLIILGLVSVKRTGAIPAAVGAWVAAIIIGTSSTGFANPAVTIARMFSDTFAGISPESVPGFVAAQIAGGITAVVVAKVLFGDET